MTQISGARRRTIVGLLFVAGFINYLDRAILSVALPLVSRDLGLDPTAKGVLLSAFFWSYAVMQLPMGWLSDRLDLRWLYSVAFAVWSLACGLTGFAGSLAVLIVLRVVLGIGESVYLPGGIKIVSLLYSADKRGLASGLVNCGTRAGLAFGAPLIAWLLSRHGWRQTFLLVGLISLVWLIPWLIACPKPGAQRAAAPTFSGLNRNLVGMCIGQIAFSYYWYLLVTWLPDYLVESRGMSVQQAGTYAVIPYLIFTLCEPLGGWMADELIRFGWNESRVRKGMISLAFVTSLLLLPAGLASNDNLAVWLIGAASMVGLATGNILAMLQRIAPPGEVGMWTGILNFSGNLSGIAAPLATGILISRTGSYYPGFVVAVAVLLAGLPSYWLVVKEMGEGK